MVGYATAMNDDMSARSSKRFFDNVMDKIHDSRVSVVKKTKKAAKGLRLPPIPSIKFTWK